jgi:two-component system heavy metal sensor histidine kinase CusS
MPEPPKEWHGLKHPFPDFRPRILHPVAPRFLTINESGRSWRFAVMGNESISLIIGADLAGFHAEIRRVGSALFVVAPLALLLLACTGWLLAGQALRPVRMITHVAGGIGARELDRRVPDVVADREFQNLVEVINGMLARIERSFRQATRFSSDAAHELKTPLTILQGQLEQAVQEAVHDSSAQRKYAELLEEVQRLKQIVRKLLLLAQADAGHLSLNREQLDLSSLVQSVAEDLYELAPNLQVTAEVPPGVIVNGDADLLKQALQNLSLNAAKFNDDRAIVRILLQVSGATVNFFIANTGPGIPIAEQDRLFERFYRADKSRNRRVDGTGLGLSLAREIARAHGGDLTLDRTDTVMTTFVLTLPLSRLA